MRALQLRSQSQSGNAWKTVYDRTAIGALGVQYFAFRGGDQNTIALRVDADVHYSAADVFQHKMPARPAVAALINRAVGPA